MLVELGTSEHIQTPFTIFVSQNVLSALSNIHNVLSL